MCRWVMLIAVFLIASPLRGGQPAAAGISECWRTLADADGAKAYRAMRRLAASPVEALSLLGKHMPAPATTITPAGIDRLIRQLASAVFAERDRAQQELARLDWQVIDPLRKAIATGGSLEWKRRVERLISQLEGPLQGARLREHRAVEVAEWIGAPMAKALLERWARGDAKSRLAQEARKTLRRLDAAPPPMAIPQAGWPKTDAFGDPLPAGVMLRLGSTRWRIGESGGSLFYTPDGKRLVVAAGTTLGIVAAADGTFLARKESNLYDGWRVDAARLAPDGKTLVASGYSYRNNMAILSLRAIDCDSLKRINEWPLMEPVLGFAAKGDAVFLKSKNGIRRFDVRAGRETGFFPLPKGADEAIAVHRSTALAATRRGDRLLVYDLSAPEKARRLEALDDRLPRSFAFSPDGKVLACGSDYRSGVILYDLESGRQIRQLKAKGGQRGQVTALAFSPDGKSLFFSHYSYSVSQSELVAWDMEQHRVRWKRKGGASGASALACSPDGRFVADAGARISIWETASGKEISNRDSVSAASIQELSFSDDGRSLLTVQESAARLWQFPAGKLTKEFTHPHVHRAVLSPNGRRLATSAFSHDLRLWDMESGREIMKLPDQGRLSGFAREFLFTPDSRRLCTWEPNFRLRVWDVHTGRLLAEHRPRPDGFPKELFDDDSNRNRRQRDLALEKGILFLGNSFCFFPDGSRFLWQFKKLRLYDMATGKHLHTFGPGIEVNGYHRPEISKDEQWLLIGEPSNTHMTLVNLRQRKVACLLAATRSGAAALSADGRCAAVLVSAGERHGIILFETATFRPRLAIPHDHGYAYRLTFSPDGRFLAAAHSDGTALVWDLHALEL